MVEAPGPSGLAACIALPIRAIGADDLLFSEKRLGCGRGQATLASFMVSGAAPVLSASFTPRAAEVIASR